MTKFCQNRLLHIIRHFKEQAWTSWIYPKSYWICNFQYEIPSFPLTFIAHLSFCHSIIPQNHFSTRLQKISLFIEFLFHNPYFRLFFFQGKYIIIFNEQKTTKLQHQPKNCYGKRKRGLIERKKETAWNLPQTKLPSKRTKGNRIMIRQKTLSSISNFIFHISYFIFEA